LKIVGGAADLEWKRRSAAELDWIWVRCRFKDGLEEKKLENEADELDWMRRSATNLRLWVCRCLVLLWVWC